MRPLRVAVLAAALPVLYVAFLAVAAVRSGLTWREMDADRDGATSLAEFFAAADVGRRPVRVRGRACTEIFSRKDGLTVKVVCPAA